MANLTHRQTESVREQIRASRIITLFAECYEGKRDMTEMQYKTAAKSLDKSLANLMAVESTITHQGTVTISVKLGD